MSNRDSYKKAFQPLHASKPFSMEALDMNMNKTHYSFSRGLAVAIVVTVLLVGSLGAAYAADVGGLRRSIRIWVRGEATEAMIEPMVENTIYTDGSGADISANVGSYSVTWTDKDGELREIGGGGVALEPGGVERPLTMDEYLEGFSGHGEVERTEDGRVTLYWYDQAVDITDRFEDGVCRLSLTRGDETLYFTVTDEGGGTYSLSSASDGYVD